MPYSLVAISTHVTLLQIKMISLTLAHQDPKLTKMEYFIVRSEIEDVKVQLELFRTEVNV